MTDSAAAAIGLVLLGSFGDGGDPPYRLHQPATALATLAGVEVHELHPHCRDRDRAALSADVLVLLMGMDVELLRLVHQRRLLGRPTVLEVNDWLPAVQRCNPVHANWSDTRAWRLLEALVAHCDAVQVSSAGLAERLAPLAPRLELVANQMAQVPPLQPRPAGPMRVGWGGSAGHYDDLAAVAPALCTWLQEHDDVLLEVMGDAPFADLFRQAPPERFRWRPAADLGGYLRWLERLDVGLAPLLATDYNDCRSDVKFLEYASRGVVPLLQRCPTYAGVREGETALLFSDSAELRAHLDALRADAQRRARLSAAAHAHVARHRRQAQHAPCQLQFYRELRRAAFSSPQRVPAGLRELAARPLEALRSRPGWRRVSERHWRRNLEGAAEQAFTAGLEALQGGQWSLAASHLRAAAAADRSDPYALVFLGQALERLDRPGLAQRAYERAAHLDPLCSRPLRALAALHRRQAWRQAEAAAALNPHAPGMGPEGTS